MEIRVDRTHPTPLYIQISGQIAYFIGTGELTSGGQLPAIRQLAGELGVAPLTIVQAFSELERQGLVETRAGVGTFIVDMAPSDLEHFRKRQLREVVEEAIAIAADKGFSPSDLARSLELHIQHSELPAVIESLFIGNYIDDSALLSAFIATEFAANRIHIQYRSIQDLRAPDATTAELLEQVSLVLAVPARITEARRLIGGNAIVIGVPIVISPESRERLERVPANAKVGLVARQTNFMQSMRNTLSAYCPQAEFAPTASFDVLGQVEELAQQVDVLIYSMGARDQIARLKMSNVLLIELAHVPDEVTISMLRGIVADLEQSLLDAEVTQPRVR